MYSKSVTIDLLLSTDYAGLNGQGKDFIKGFNAGYLIGKESAKVADQILETDNHAVGFVRIGESNSIKKRRKLKLIS